MTVLVPLGFGIGFLVAFGCWQRHTPYTMVPPRLLAARSFTVTTTVYLISYMSLSATLFYVSLLYQDVVGWTVLRTGLSWLFMNVPFLFMAQLAGRLEHRITPTAIVSGGCMAGAIGLAALAVAGPSSPFVLTAAGYLISGAGYGMLVPALTHLAMRDVPEGVSGAASAVLNASRQIGTSVGLAVLGSIAVSSAISDWHARMEHFPTSVRAASATVARQVAGGRIDAVIRAMGPAYRHPAAQSFAHGYHIAIGCGAGCLVLASAISVLGLRQRRTRTTGRDRGPGR
jgi:predicted MFS family arabinose efflux permease